MRLRAPKAKKEYSSDTKWLNAVYKNNKEYIDHAIPGIEGKTSKQMFKNLIKQYMSQGMTAYQSAQAITHTSAFTSKGADSKPLFQENFYKGLMGNTYARNRFLKLTGKERKQIRPGKFEYVGHNTYIYGDVIIEPTGYKDHVIKFYIHRGNEAELEMLRDNYKADMNAKKIQQDYGDEYDETEY